MAVKIEVVGVTIVNGINTDTLYLQTNLQAGVWPYMHTAEITMPVARGKALEYCKTNFPDVPVEDLTFHKS